jgi:CSLREA domain-containing protein
MHSSGMRSLSRVAIVAIAALSLFFLAGLIAQPVHAAAANFYVGTQNDDAGTSTTGCGTNGNTTCSLRDAITAANGTAGASQINIPAGTYTLSQGELDLGALANQAITVFGTDAATTTIKQDGLHSLFVTDPNLNSGQLFTFQGLTITGGLDAGFGGGGIQAGAVGQNLSIINCIITGNKSTIAGGGGVIYTGDGTVTITGSTFSNNTAASPASGGSSTGGGLLLANLFSATAANVTITGTTFDANTAGSAGSDARAQGGAIAVASSAMHVNISKSTFTNNKAIDDSGGSGQGGALFNEGGGSLSVQYSRLVGNTATQGSALFQGTATTTASEDWWGTNASPASLISGTSNFTPYLTLTQTAALSTLTTGQNTTLTASFLKNSAGGTESVSNLDVLLGLSVTWNNAINGTLSNQQTTIQPSGTATATFTATTPGQGSADATVDSGTATTNPTITINATTPTHLVVTVPGSATAGAPFAVQATAEDDAGNVATTYAGPITLTPFVTDSGATSLGPATPTNGVATFTVTLTKATPDQLLDAFGVGLTGMSATFPVAAAAPATIVGAPPSENATVNGAFAPLTATVTDTYGNPVSGVTVTLAATTAGSGATLGGGTLSQTTNASGVATFADLTANAKAGTYTVATTAPSVTTPASFTLTNTAGAPGGITATAGTSQSATVNTAFATNLKALVTDASGNPVPNATVTFTAPALSGPSGTFTGGGISITAQTDAAGTATAPTFTANTVAGSYTVTAGVGSVASTADFALTNTPGAPAAIAANPGASGQSAQVGHTFANPLAVTVSDQYGNPVGTGVTVAYTVTPAGGASATLNSGTATTDAAGQTSVTATANTTAGSYTAAASVSGIATPATFALANTPGAPAHIAATAGASQTVAVNTPFATLKATVTDTNGNTVPGAAVTFTAPGGAVPSGTFTGGSATATVTTDAGGVATAPSFTANTTAGGPYTVTASVAGSGSPAMFSLTNTSGAAATLTPSAAATPQSATVNTTFTVPLAATLADQYGNPISGVTITFTAPASGASGIFTGGGATTTATTNGLGLATAPSLTANGIAGGYSVAASGGGVSNPTAFALTNLAGAPSGIAATAGGGQHAVVGTAFGAPLQATVKDANGNLVPNATVTFAAPTGAGLSTGAFPGGATATATTNAQGVATAPTLTAGTVVGSFTATASVPGAGTPATFTLTNTPGAAATVTATAGGGQHAAVTTAFPVALAVSVTDRFGNPVPGDTVTFTAPGSGASGAFLGGGNTATAQTNAQGVATAPVFTANDTAGGPYTVNATVGGVTTPATFALTNTAAALTDVAVSAPGGLGTLGGTPTLKVGQTVQFTAMGNYADNSTQNLTGQVQWSSSNQNVASVDSSGNVTAKGAGTATITASYGGKQGQSTVTVTAPVITGVQPAPAPASRPGTASTPPPGGPPAPTPAPVPTGR